MSWSKANAAGAKQKAINTNRTTRDTNVRKTFGGECAMSGCSNAATVRRGKHNYCRDCAAGLD